MNPIFKSFVEDNDIPAPKSGWKPIEQKTVIENFNKDRKYSFKTLREVLVESGLTEEKKEPVVEKNLEPILEAIKKVVEEKSNPQPLVEEKIEVPAIIEEKVEVVNEKSLIDKASEYIKRRVKIEEGDSFQQPVSPNIPNNLSDINKRVRYLEQWLAKVSMDGPGSGEVRFLNLDDVDAASISDRDTHKILRFKPDSGNNPAFDSVFFDFLSGDQGEIFSLKYNPFTGYTSNANVAPGLTYYDPERDTLEILHKDGAATYTGLDNYIRITNSVAGNTIPRGTFVSFAGVDASTLVPIVEPFVADANAVPYLSVGVTATELASNTRGRAIVLGEIEDIDTTGNSVGEVWTTGALLWANPSIPGALTITQPTAPNVAISVAAVLKSDATEGRLLVRPTITPRLYYGSFVSTVPQTAANTTSAFAITIDRTEFASGFVIEDNTKIKAEYPGLYNIQFSIQFTSTNASAKNIFIFPKKNGVNIPDSSTVYTITGNGTNLVPYLNYVVSLNANDFVELFFGVSDVAAVIASPAVPAYSPNIPPVILTVTQVAL